MGSDLYVTGFYDDLRREEGRAALRAEHERTKEAARALLAKWPKCTVAPGCTAIAVAERTDDDCVPKDHACEEHFTRYMAIDMAWGLTMRVHCGEEMAALAKLVGDG